MKNNLVNAGSWDELLKKFEPVVMQIGK